MTDETKHHPGPWRVEPDYQSRRTGDIYSSDGYEEILVGFNIVAEDGTEVVGCEGITDAEDTNARLIAAAPEMLEALKAVLDYFPTDGFHFDKNSIAGIIESAIDKAEGRSK